MDIKGVYNLLVFNTASQNVRFPQLLIHQLWINGLKPILLAEMENIFSYINPHLLPNRRVKNQIKRIPSWIAPDPSLKREMENRIKQSLNYKKPKQNRGGFYVNALMSKNYKTRFGMLRDERFETSIIAGLHKFSPLINDELMTFLYRIPPKMLNFGGQSKGIPRRMLANRYPGLGFEQQKKSHYTSYRIKILEQEIESAWRKLDGTPALAQLGIVDPKKLGEFAQKCIAEHNIAGMNLLGKILQTELWTQKH